MSSLASRRSFAAFALGFAAAMVAFPASAGAVTQTYTYSGGEQVFTVPAGVTSIQVTATGAPGDSSAFGGLGGDPAVVTGTLAVTPGQVLYVEVGNAGLDVDNPGCNGGGPGGLGDGLDGGNGGGASDVRTISVGGSFCGVQSSTSLNSRLIVAAGGGGGGDPGAGGDAGMAAPTTQDGVGGGPGTATAGGLGGSGSGGVGNGFNGVLGAGGAGGEGFPGGGGGGGGLYGGGGGGSGSESDSAGGGGGSNLVPSGGTAGIDPGGPAQVAITYTPDPGVAPTTLTASASGNVTRGRPVFATATLAGGANPTGQIGFALYGPNDATCSGTAVFTDFVPVSGNGTYQSAEFTPTAPGTYRWAVAYFGDANNSAALSPCNAPGATVAVRGRPRIGKTANAHPVSGRVLINTGDGRGYTLLTEDRLIPIGSRINACDGRLDLTTQLKEGGFQTARFWAGRFRVLQSTRRSRMTLKLIGPLDNCSKPSRARRPQSLGLTDLSSPAAQVSRKKGGSRKLVGKGRCNCRAKGRRGSATTLATIWVLEDRSGGITRVQVRKGVVVFRNSYTGKRKKVRRGETAVARPPRR